MSSPPHGGTAPGCSTPQAEAQAGPLQQQSGAKTELKKPSSLLEAPPGENLPRHLQPHSQTQQQLLQPQLQAQPSAQWPEQPQQMPAQPLRTEAKEGGGLASEAVGYQERMRMLTTNLLARIGQQHGDGMMRQEYQRVQDAEDVNASVRELMRRYAPELKESFEDLLLQNYREKVQMHDTELQGRILCQNGHETMK